MTCISFAYYFADIGVIGCYAYTNHKLLFTVQTSLFGEGTYLSSDLVVAMNFSPSGNVWPNSVFSSPVR